MLSADANIAATLRRAAQSDPHRLAILEPAGSARGRTRYVPTTYGALDDQVDRLAQGLRRAGLADGARVVLMAPPSAAFFAMTFALFRARAVPVFIDPGMGVRRLRRCLAKVEPQGFVGTPKALAARWLLARRETRGATLASIDGPWPGTIRIAGTGAPVDERERSRADAPAAPGDDAAVLFTSGSTGAPKGALYTHANFGAQIAALRRAFAIEAGEMDLCTFPLFALFAPALGMTAVIPEMDFTRPAHADPAKLADAVQAFGCRNLFGSPALLDRLSTYAMQEGVSFPSLKRIISAGAPVQPRIVRAAAAMLRGDAEVHTPYGATEALPIASIGSREILTETAAAAAAGRGLCVGRPVPGMELRILGEDGPMRRGAVGEIVVAGPQVTAAYFNDPAANAAYKLRDPALGAERAAAGDRAWHHTDLADLATISPSIPTWHRTGDLGYLDPDGRLWYCGRKAHRVSTAAGPLDSIPCEGVFDAHAAVRRSALVGRGAAGAMQPVLCVEPVAPLGRAARDELRRELLALRTTAPGAQPVEEIRFFRSLPVDRRHNAKIDRELLKRRLDE